METQTEEIILIESGVGIDVFPPYSPSIFEVEVQKLKKIMVQHQQKKIPLDQYQKLSKQICELKTQNQKQLQNQMFLRKKKQNLQGQAQKLNQEKNEIFSMIIDVMAYRASTCSYDLFLVEQYLMLKIQVVHHGFSYEFTDDVLDFIAVFHRKSEPIQYLLCELYIHNFLLNE